VRVEKVLTGNFLRLLLLRQPLVAKNISPHDHDGNENREMIFRFRISFEVPVDLQFAQVGRRDLRLAIVKVLLGQFGTVLEAGQKLVRGGNVLRLRFMSTWLPLS